MGTLRQNLGALALAGTMVAGGMAAAPPASAACGSSSNYFAPCAPRQSDVYDTSRPGRAAATIGSAYRGANQWCSDNALTCAIATGIGFTLLAPFIAPARG